MSVLIFVESNKGKFKKSALEAVYYGAQIAKQKGSEAIALLCSPADNPAELGKYGASKVIHQNLESHTDNMVVADLIKQAADANGAEYVIMTNSSLGKSLAGRVAIKLDASLVSGATSLPESDSVSKKLFSGKAIASIKLTADKKVISVMGNSVIPEEIGSDAPVEAGSYTARTGRVTVKESKTSDGVVPLPEAELVVSAGRGMKGPENWGIIDEMAGILGATTACSRPVADTGWRPHHEHVGQTGVAIRPNLYIAIGISGAIQHLAGVNNSKTIVVINKDPEAPFFKAADYGVVGDLFDVVPRLNEAFRKFKQ